MKTWKLYKHTLMLDCPSKGKSYIGITSVQNPNCRWSNGRGYSKKNEVFYRAIKKYGWDNFSHEILIDNIPTLEEASKLELEYIAKYHTCILDPNCWGYNMSKGGQGRGHPQSEETKEKISKALKGRTFSEEHKAHLKDSTKKSRKQIICIETGIIYESISAAARMIGTFRENIRFALHGDRCSAAGYHWAYIWDYKKQAELKSLNGKHKYAKRRIQCIETNIIYESVSALGRVLGISGSSVANYWNKAPNGIAFFKGYHWRYIDN